MFKALVVSVVLLSLAGCQSSVPKQIAVDPQVNLIDYKQVLDQQNVDANQNGENNAVKQQARWGGIIAKVTNLKQHTVLEVVNFDLSSQGKPLVKQQSKGRFKIYVDGFIDPLVYRQGKLITALGEVGAQESGKIGEYEYVFPTLSKANVHLWKKTKPVQLAYTNPWIFGPAYFPHSSYHPRRVFYRPVSTHSSKGSSKSRQQKSN